MSAATDTAALEEAFGREPNALLCAIIATARDFGAFVNVAQTKGPRTMPFPTDAVCFAVSLLETGELDLVG